MAKMTGPYYEGRNYCCYVCKWFAQTSETYRNGVCLREPPDKIDENEGGVGGKPTGYEPFSNVMNSATGFCGKFEPATVEIDVSDIPPLEPAA